MSHCRSQTPESTPAQDRCPVSATRGVPVRLRTVKAVLTEAALRQLEPGSFHLCTDAACEVVYFDERGRTLARGDLRVPVWQKEPIGSRTLCYRFGENEADLRTGIAREGSSSAVERIRAHIHAGRCACEVRSPRGTWCLADVIDAVQRAARTADAAGVSEGRVEHA